MRPTYSPDIVEDLEHQLKMSLRKVEPSPEFVTHLHTRLTDPARMSIERRQSLGLGMLLVAVSCMSGMVLIGLLRLFRPASTH
jgi:hypothetical protein